MKIKLEYFFCVPLMLMLLTGCDRHAEADLEKANLQIADLNLKVSILASNVYQLEMMQTNLCGAIYSTWQSVTNLTSWDAQQSQANSANFNVLFQEAKKANLFVLDWKKVEDLNDQELREIVSKVGDLDSRVSDEHFRLSLALSRSRNPEVQATPETLSPSVYAPVPVHTSTALSIANAISAGGQAFSQQMNQQILTQQQNFAAQNAENERLREQQQLLNAVKQSQGSSVYNSHTSTFLSVRAARMAYHLGPKPECLDRSTLKIMKIFTFVICLALLTGCATTTVDGLGPPPKHLDRVKFIPYDSKVRPPNPNIEIFDQAPTDRKFKVIAHMTCEGAYHEEVVMTEALIYEAKMLGAGGMIRLPSVQTATRSAGVVSSFGTRSLFKANAIVFEKP